MIITRNTKSTKLSKIIPTNHKTKQKTHTFFLQTNNEQASAFPNQNTHKTTTSTPQRNHFSPPTHHFRQLKPPHFNMEQQTSNHTTKTSFCSQPRLRNHQKNPKKKKNTRTHTHTQLSIPEQEEQDDKGEDGERSGINGKPPSTFAYSPLP